VLLIKVTIKIIIDVEEYISIGEEVSLDCSSTRAQHLGWYDGPYLKLTSMAHGISIQAPTNDTLTLTIHNITVYHYGVYLCIDEDSGEILVNYTLQSPQGEPISQEAIWALNMWDVSSWVLNMNEMNFD